MKKKVYLHIGVHKTATTFLQWQVFPKLKGISLVRKSNSKKLLYRIKNKKLKGEDFEEIRQSLEKKRKGDQPLLISYEGFSGSPFSQKKMKSSYQILSDLRNIFPKEEYDVHVILGLRNQVDLMTSLYIEFLHQGGDKKEETYIQELVDHEVFDNYLYNQYIDHIESLYGDQYFVWVYENFKEQKEDYLLKLLNFLGFNHIPKYEHVQLNRSYGRLQAKLARRLNKWFKTNKSPKGFIPEVKIKLKRNYSKKIVKKLFNRKRKKITLSPRSLLQNELSYKIHYKRYELSPEMKEKIMNYYIQDNEQLNQRENLNLPEVYFHK
ncbi:hypothetical protein J2R98_002593 [Alkalibacillus filiformis]|uniref:Sulfotransferase domain-containing protein n=1 Tax=Alkalibacillus filiformis TaxID=200990 RepID=A0ABU0DWA0_9BACI|nr:hypothetical protein [Alkalibacillus filiformis]MDQ0352742.1 hypothetical protein [Alkalibacillus filiformis]